MTTIRRAGDDADAIRSIYTPIVRETAISFEEEPPTATEIRRRMENASDRYPWLVCESAGDVCGFVKAGPHKSRAAYRWAVDVSVYVHEDARHCGVGRGLYEALLEFSRYRAIVPLSQSLRCPTRRVSVFMNPWDSNASVSSAMSVTNMVRGMM